MKHLGIIGDGQLSRYMAEACRRLKIPCSFLGSSNSPASFVCENAISHFSELVEKSDVITFENEFFDSENLIRSIQTNKPAVKVFPSLDSVEILRQKHRQKLLLQSLSIPTAKYLIFEEKDVDDYLRKQNRAFSDGCVLKWSTGGYGSKGLMFCGPGSRLGDARDFCLQARAQGKVLYSEEMIPFEKELAILGGRNSDGEIRIFPLVQTVQNLGICHKVQGPYLDSELEAQARQILTRLSTELNYVGVLALEFFLTNEGNLLVNELAPRVHNSGHYSMLGCSMDQFELHVRCVMNMELPEVFFPKHFAMWNILGPKDIPTTKVPPDYVPSKEISEGVYLYWYQKTELRARRKLGHLCAIADTAEEIEDRMGRMKGCDEKIWQSQ